MLEIRLCAKDLTGSKALLPTTRKSDLTHVIENDVNVCKQISSLEEEGRDGGEESHIALQEGLEGYFRDPVFDQNMVRESGKR